METVKRYVAETTHRVRLHDLIREETETAWEKFASDEFTPQVQPFTQEVFAKRLRQYEALMEHLMSMLATLAYHDGGENAHLLVRCIERLARPIRDEGLTALLSFQHYPALLALYSAGCAALAARRYVNLAMVLHEPQYRDRRHEVRPVLYKLNVASVFGDLQQWVPRPREREYTPVNNHLFELLRDVLRDYLPDDDEYEETFELFEHLLALTYLDLVRQSWAPIGRYPSRWQYEPERSPVTRFFRIGLAQGDNWDLLKAGLFGGSADRLSQLLETYREWLSSVTRSWGWA